MIYTILLFVIFSFNSLNCVVSNQTLDRYLSQIPQNLFNIELDEQNPSSFWPPITDAGGQSPFKYPFSFAHTARYSAGWARQVTVLDLPIATRMSGVQMRLIKGGIREMHWHLSSEWAFVIYGNCRITCVSPEGLSFVDDLEAGDLWFFPGGWPHSIQGTGEDGTLFLLVLNEGNFSEFDTFLLTDLLNHMPREVLSKNFQTPESTFDNIPRSLYIFPGALPRPLEEEIMEASLGTGIINQSLSFRTSRMGPNVTRTGGYAKIIDRNNFPVTDIAAGIVTLRPGGLRELHWHTNADEWQYYVKGKARVTVFDANGLSRTMDFRAGDVGYIPQTFPHYIENTCEEDLIFLAVFPTPFYDDVSLAQWLAHTPPLLVDQHIRTGESFINRINKTEAIIVPW